MVKPAFLFYAWNMIAEPPSSTPLPIMENVSMREKAIILERTVQNDLATMAEIYARIEVIQPDADASAEALTDHSPMPEAVNRFNKISSSAW